MFIPKSFLKSDQNKLHDFIEKHSFATLISQDGSDPVATHLPLLLERELRPHGTLIGHMARANPQWKNIEGQSVLSIFHGPHAYISPSWYEVANAVPTWNYVAVHVYGTIKLIVDQDRLLEILRRSVDFYESDLPQQWTIEKPDSEFIDGLLDGIVGFEITINRIEGKWKLNQNHNLERRNKVIRALNLAGGDNQKKIAKLMLKEMDE